MDTPLLMQFKTN